jgi:hypothetical protein
MKTKLTIAVDFDGTCVTHEFPAVGQDIGAVPVLKKLAAAGHKIILLTMRSGETLEAAKQWFADNDIPLFGVNWNKTQWRWTKSRKVHADVYIDDQALGAPLKELPSLARPYYIDWEAVNDWFEKRGLI